MSEIELTCSFGGEKKKVVISQPHGIGGDIWFIHVNDYFYGQLIRREGEWCYYDQWLETAADIQILGEIIDNNITFGTAMRH